MLASLKNQSTYRHTLLADFLEPNSSSRNMALLHTEGLLDKDLQLCLAIVIDDGRPLFSKLDRIIDALVPLIPKRAAQIERDKHRQLPIMSTSRRCTSTLTIDTARQEAMRAETLIKNWGSAWVAPAQVTGYNLRASLLQRANMKDSCDRLVQMLEADLGQLKKDIDLYELCEKADAIEAPAAPGSAHMMPKMLTWQQLVEKQRAEASSPQPSQPSVPNGPRHDKGSAFQPGQYTPPASVAATSPSTRSDTPISSD